MMISEGLEPGDDENNSILRNEQEILSAVEAFQQYVDLNTEEAYTELGLGDGSEQQARFRLEQYTGDPSSFQLLEDIGTNPNITYLGQQPGPEAHQVDGPTAYEDVDLLDERQEDLDEGTVGRIDGVSL